MPDNEENGKPGEERRAAGGAKSSYDVLFVGLFCFKKEAGVAVMPDGTNPDDDDVEAHEPFLVVDPNDVISATGWEPDDLTAEGIYKFGKCTIEITPATTKGVINRNQHDDNVTKARDIDPTFQYRDEGWDSRILAMITIGQGTLEFLRRPDRPSTAQGLGAVSRLRVPHEGNVVVTVDVAGEPQARVLTLKPGGDVAVVNGYLTDTPKTGDPLKLFGPITQSGTFNTTNPPGAPNVGVIGQNYQVFRINLPFTLADSIGCCPPP